MNEGYIRVNFGRLTFSDLVVKVWIRLFHLLNEEDPRTMSYIYYKSNEEPKITAVSKFDWHLDIHMYC